jgi:recombination associated protein RdgC
MFKNLTLYSCRPDWTPDLHACRQQADKARFVPCTPSQSKSFGFVEPRYQDHAELIEVVGSHWLLNICIQKKVLPASVVKKHTAERLQKIAEETGRKVGKKLKSEVKLEVTHELLAKAFSKEEHVVVWIDTRTRRMVTNASSMAKADDVLRLLVDSFSDFGAALLPTVTSPVSCMSAWLQDGDPPHPFSIDQQCELKNPDVAKQAVRYSHHNLDIDEIRAHLKAGKTPTRLAMTWDSRVSFVLTETMQIKGIQFLDVVFIDAPEAQGNDFDANASIATGELAQLIEDLVTALGGQPDTLGAVNHAEQDEPVPA